jgi:hypothetical protein
MTGSYTYKPISFKLLFANFLVEFLSFVLFLIYRPLLGPGIYNLLKP